MGTWAKISPMGEHGRAQLQKGDCKYELVFVVLSFL